MATITPVTPVLAGATVTRAATTPAGDVIPYTGGDILVHFENGHASPITVNIVPTVETLEAAGAGPVSVPTRSLAIVAGAEGAFLLREGQISAYVNASRQIPITYTSGDAALTVAAFRV